MTPTIVFAEYGRLPELVMLSRQPLPSCKVWNEEAQCYLLKPLPVFSVFKHMDYFPRVPDRDLDALRVAEQRGLPKGKGRAFQKGETVKLVGGGFEGLVGTVLQVVGRYTEVVFSGWDIPIKIASDALLRADCPVP